MLWLYKALNETGLNETDFLNISRNWVEKAKHDEQSPGSLTGECVCESSDRIRKQLGPHRIYVAINKS